MGSRPARLGEIPPWARRDPSEVGWKFSTWTQICRAGPVNPAEFTFSALLQRGDPRDFLCKQTQGFSDEQTTDNTFGHITITTVRMVKRCAWGTCKSDSRHPERLKREDGSIAKFHSFPAAKKEQEWRECWIRACCRGDGFVCNEG